MQKENRIRLEPLVHESLRYYVAEKREAIKPVMGAGITESMVVSEVMRVFLEGEGHYPPRTANIVEAAVASANAKQIKTYTREEAMAICGVAPGTDVAFIPTVTEDNGKVAGK